MPLTTYRPFAATSWVKRSLALLLGVLVASLGLEFAARWAHKIDYGQATRIDNERRVERPMDRLFTGVPSTFRILVLGDSMAYSPGIKAADLWSTLLETDLERRLSRQFEVFNAARGGDNTYGQLEFVRQALPNNRIDLVLLVYNHNDVYGSRPTSVATADLAVAVNGSRSSDHNQGLKASLEEEQQTSTLLRPGRQARVARIARKLRHASRFLELLLTRLGLQSRAWGILVPGSEFHHLATQAYLPDAWGWQSVQQELRQMKQIIDHNDAQLAVYLLPQFASLEHDFFADTRSQLKHFFMQLDTPHGFGHQAFEGRPWKELAMSPFDGHPNQNANREIARVIGNWLQRSGLLEPRSIVRTGPRSRQSGKRQRATKRRSDSSSRPINLEKVPGVKVPGA